ncbi:ABC transporter ATP-binding protein [Brytella acorum]|uniref:ABC transporter ATP-binding protein n=1 Tax=Brytella acorum TaxID=2959299 RepID=A0AA35VC59_9PROT|nr:ABC transporter ATP-binding protein [Brytella acorum]MDF3624182.1 ABC transporter ATP-binding protein [Brytella acorum]CAI9120688.1 ABC transporter ATP-binding protein [Brytella acorum]
MNCIEATGLRKQYGKKIAVDGIDLGIGTGRIVGLIGPNGAGKTTTLDAILGLIPFEGSLKVMGCDPWRERERLMREVSFIADVAVLPRWLKVRNALDYVQGVHPRFDRSKAERFLARTDIPMKAKVGQLSKGMVAQLHLALVMAIDARLLVLDEPTLGLDILYRRAFYTSLLNDYFDQERTILVTTHQVEEVQDILTDVIFIDHGRIILSATMDDIEARYVELMPRLETVDAARKLGPVTEYAVFGRPVMLFDGVARGHLAPMGEIRRPGIADLFVMMMGRDRYEAPGEAA